MGSIQGLTKDRMLEIEAASVVGGLVDLDGNLILTKKDGSTRNAGHVVGPQGTPAAPFPSRLNPFPWSADYSDLNSVIENGWYSFGDIAYVNGPPGYGTLGSYCKVSVWAFNADWLNQELEPIFSDPKQRWRRSRQSGSTWSPWRRVYSEAAELGTMFSGTAAERDAFYPAPVNGNKWYNTTRQHGQTYIVKSGISTGWYLDAGMNVTLSPNSVNPIPNSETDIGNGSFTFTLGANEYIHMDLFLGGAFQINTAMGVQLHCNIDGVTRRTVYLEVAGNSPRVNASQDFTYTFGPGSHTVKLRVYASLTNAAVFHDGWLRGVSVSPIRAF